MGTRIQDKSRPTKRPQATGTWSTLGTVFVLTSGKAQRVDDRGFPTYDGVQSPVSVAVTVIA